MERFIPLVLAIVAAPLSGLAQSRPASIATVADPAAAVPAPRYRSALSAGPHGVADAATDWKAANAEVGQFTRGHGDILKWEQTHGATPPAAAPTTRPPMPGMLHQQH